MDVRNGNIPSDRKESKNEDILNLNQNKNLVSKDIKRNKKTNLIFDESIKNTSSLEKNNLDILKSNKALFEEIESIQTENKKDDKISHEGLNYQLTKTSNDKIDTTNKFKLQSINKGNIKKVKFKTNASIKKSIKKENETDNVLTYRQLSFQHLKEENVKPILVFKRNIKKSSKKDQLKSSFKAKKVVFSETLVNEKTVKSVKYVTDKVFDPNKEEEKVICSCGCNVF